MLYGDPDAAFAAPQRPRGRGEHEGSIMRRRGGVGLRIDRRAGRQAISR
jgi:hypothetical protein